MRTLETSWLVRKICSEVDPSNSFDCGIGPYCRQGIVENLFTGRSMKKIPQHQEVVQF